MLAMKSITRRGFLAATAATAAASFAKPLGMPIGCQTWPVRQEISKDLDGTLATLASSGFETIELCSPASYGDFKPLLSMTPQQLRAKIQAAGLQCVSCHYGFGELKGHLDERIDYAKGLGLRQMIIATFGIPRSAKMTDWMSACDAANKLGERTAKAGIQLGFHNHEFEFQKVDGELIYDKLMGEFDPKYIKSQFQVSVIRLGYHAADYFEKYPGRFISMHVQDWSPDKAKEVATGTGIVDWKKTFAAAKKGGIKNYFVEMDLDAMKASVPYLKQMS